MLLASLFMATGCDPVASSEPEQSAIRNSQFPIVPPPECRLENYTVRQGRHSYGSCLHTAVQDLLVWHGLNDQAATWRANYGGPANVEEVSAIADRLGLQHAETTSGEEAFLQRCSDDHLGAAIYWEADRPHDHAVVFVGFDAAGDAILLGTNSPVITTMPRAEFLATWRRSDGGAFTILPPTDP